jgi:hypothetical protein
MEWISIKDGMPDKKCIAFYQNSHGKGRTIMAVFIKKFTDESHTDEDWTEYCEENDTYYCPEGWYECIDNWCEVTKAYVNEGEITHWMPLPNPPKGE